MYFKAKFVFFVVKNSYTNNKIVISTLIKVFCMPKTSEAEKFVRNTFFQK